MTRSRADLDMIAALASSSSLRVAPTAPTTVMVVQDDPADDVVDDIDPLMTGSQKTLSQLSPSLAENQSPVLASSMLKEMANSGEKMLSSLCTEHWDPAVGDGEQDRMAASDKSSSTDSPSDSGSSAASHATSMTTIPADDANSPAGSVVILPMVLGLLPTVGAQQVAEFGAQQVVPTMAGVVATLDNIQNNAHISDSSNDDTGNGVFNGSLAEGLAILDNDRNNAHITAGHGDVSMPYNLNRFLTSGSNEGTLPDILVEYTTDRDDYVLLDMPTPDHGEEGGNDGISEYSVGSDWSDAAMF